MRHVLAASGLILYAAVSCYAQRPKPLPSPVSRMVANAHRQTRVTRYYDPAYVKLAYPNGDVPPDRGVCTDVVIRALRATGKDLQKLVHDDMSSAFGAYPHKWGLRRPDANIDHRRVPNLQAYFARHGKSLPATKNAGDYLPGDIVAWQLPSGRDHIGVVSDTLVDAKRRTVIHNIGQGAREEDVLFVWKITGHYRYFKR